VSAARDWSPRSSSEAAAITARECFGPDDRATIEDVILDVTSRAEAGTSPVLAIRPECGSFTTQQQQRIALHGRLTVWPSASEASAYVAYLAAEWSSISLATPKHTARTAELCA